MTDIVIKPLLRTEKVSPDRFKLGLLAQFFSAEESVNSLLAQSSYQDKIQILDHQVNTALYVLNNFSHRALLADEVGLGKTIEAGMILKEYLTRKISTKILILTPATLVYQWQEELRSKFGEYFHIPEDPEDYNNYDQIIVSIDTAKTERHAAVSREVYWDLLIIDEAHKLKNKETLNYKFVKSLSKERCFMLTATPLQNNILELWNLIDLLHPGYLETKAKFIENFVADEDGLKMKNKDELREKLGKIMIRTLRKDTKINFAPRTVKTILLEYSPEEFKFYNEAVQFIKQRYEAIKKFVPSEEGLSKAELKKIADKYKQQGLLTFRLIMLTRQITSSIRTGVEALKRYKEGLEDLKEVKKIEYLINSGNNISKDTKVDSVMDFVKKTKEKIIIFTTFIHSQDIISNELALAGVSCVKFNGKMNAEEKEVAIEDFRENKQVLICTDAGSEGRNLQFARIIINFDLPWNPMRVEQRIGRVHRIGQEKEVLIYNLAIKDTVESYILNRLYEKIDLFQTAIGDMDLILSQLETKKSLDMSLFESFIEDKDIDVDFDKAKEQAEEIKSFDREVFDSNES